MAGRVVCSLRLNAVQIVQWAFNLYIYICIDIFIWKIKNKQKNCHNVDLHFQALLMQLKVVAPAVAYHQKILLPTLVLKAFSCSRFSPWNSNSGHPRSLSDTVIIPTTQCHVAQIIRPILLLQGAVCDNLPTTGTNRGGTSINMYAET